MSQVRRSSTLPVHHNRVNISTGGEMRVEQEEGEMSVISSRVCMLVRTVHQTYGP